MALCSEPSLAAFAAAVESNAAAVTTRMVGRVSSLLVQQRLQLDQYLGLSARHGGPHGLVGDRGLRGQRWQHRLSMLL